MSDMGISASDLSAAETDLNRLSDSTPRRITGPNGIGTNSYQLDAYAYGANPNTAGYSNPNRIAMKHSTTVISAGVRFTIQEILYFVRKSGAPSDTEVKISDVFNPDKPELLEGQKMVIEWTTV